MPALSGNTGLLNEAERKEVVITEVLVVVVLLSDQSD